MHTCATPTDVVNGRFSQAIFTFFLIFFRCHALSSRSHDFGLHSPNFLSSHLPGLESIYLNVVGEFCGYMNSESGCGWESGRA